MVIEALGLPSSGALQFLLGCVEDSLRLEPRPWAIVEGNDGQVLYPPAFSRVLREQMAAGRLLWVRIPERDIPDVFLKLLQSGLFAGVFLRAFEGLALGDRFRVWLRRWQLASEKNGTHWLWQHRHPCPRIGVALSLNWHSKRKFEINRGHSLLESHSWPSVRSLFDKISQKDSQQAPQQERELCLIAN